MEGNGNGKPGHGDIWENEGNDYKKVWIRIFVDIERQDVEDTMRERSTRTLYNSLMNNWEKKEYIEPCTGEDRRGIVWWKIGVWRMKEVIRNSELGIWPICSKE